MRSNGDHPRSLDQCTVYFLTRSEDTVLDVSGFNAVVVLATIPSPVKNCTSLLFSVETPVIESLLD